MGPHWLAVTVTALLALYTAWMRRHTWKHPSMGTPTQALALHATGLLLIGPPGEYYGDFNLWMLGFENCEDILGHTLLLWSAFLLAARAFQTLGWQRWIPAGMHLAQLGTVMILIAAAVTGMVDTPSKPGDAGDSAYWNVALYLVAPAFAIAVWANLLVAVEPTARRFTRVMGAAQAATFSLGLAGCLSRFIIGAPALTYWFLAASMFGMTVVCWLTWQHLMRPVRQLTYVMSL